MASPQTINLHGDWQLARADGAFACTYAVPGDVHSALIAAGHIPHPYIGKNELAVRWVANDEWLARRSFTLTEKPQGSYFLDIDYLDTVAEVRVNGALVLSAQNCFQRYRPDVSGELKLGENSIEILFKSNPMAANALQAAQPFYIPYSTNNCLIPNSNMLRKPACHFGWDWNLAITPFGAYGRLELSRANVARIEHIETRQNHLADGSVELVVSTTLFAEHGGGEIEITTQFAGQSKTSSIAIGTGEFHVHETFHVETPKLWWPAGQGEQFLYALEVQCDGSAEKRRIGLRKMELLTDKDATGSRFAFRVNGREIFCKGANWIPSDALPSAATPELTRKLLQAAVDANMNMLRVWGGGYYELNYFYDLCDELGLLVWQDFMFSCCLYPSTDEFLKEVQGEVSYQVKRLQHHACLALWCGDNELLGALTWFEVSCNNRDRYLVNYDRLNRLLETTMKAADKNGIWWPSSPSPGILDFGDTWHDDSKGDMHFWSVWHEGREFEHYYDVKPRFCSEFGFQSFPSLRLAKEFVESAEDLNISSSVMEHHQRNKGGNARIAETMFRNFRFPMDFGNFVYLSQIQHGLAMRMAVEYWRSLKPHCMGALYWQLNDTWPVASWSGLDHGGDWKLMHYMAQRFFAPIMVTARRDTLSRDVIVSAVNDHGADDKIVATIKFVSLDSSVTEIKSFTAAVPMGNGVEIARFAAADVRSDGVYMFDWTDRQGVAARNHFAPVAYKHLALPKPNIAANSVIAGDVVQITLQAQNLALYVSLETSVAGHFSNNAFDLLAGESCVITFAPAQISDLTPAIANLIVRDLYSSSH